MAEQSRQQYPVYYISHVLTGLESRYLLIEKFAYALLIASRKLRPYFESHLVTVLTDQPLRSALKKYGSSGRMVKWAIELAPYGISYEPKRAIKAQALVDFVAECLAPHHEDAQPEEPAAAWMLYVDGFATSGGSGAGLTVVSPTGHVHKQALKFLFKASNNEAEYEALLTGMDLCCTLGVEHLRAFFDSQLIVSQVMGEYEARDAIIMAYLAKVKERSKSFTTFKIKHVPRLENRQADALSKLTSSSPDGYPKSTRWEILPQPTIGPEVVAWVDKSSTWMDPLISYLQDGTLLLDPKDANRIERKSQWFTLYGVLYKKAFA